VKTARLSNTIAKAAVALLAIAMPAVGALACGSSGPAASSLVNDTFSSRANIESGQVDLSLGLAPTSSGATARSLSLRLTGPFQNSSTPGKLPRFSLKLALDAGGHPIEAGATATGSQLFVQLAGTWFVAPQSTYKAIEQGYAQATKEASSGKSHSTFASLGIEPRKWLSEPSTVGTTTVDGEAVYHVTAGVNVAAFLHDVSKLSQSGGALSGAVPGVGAISASTISELAKSIKSAHVDVFTGKRDHLLRRLSLTAAVVSTPQTQALLSGSSSAQISLDLQLSQLNEPQSIAAPSKPRPFSELLPALQQLFGALQGSSTGTSLGG
jgi:hypothetical protein